MAKIITFSGSDGTGKTTIGRLIYHEIKSLNYKVEYRVEFSYFLLGHLLRLYGKLTSRDRVVAFRYNLIKDDSKFRHKIVPYLVYLDLLIEYFCMKFFKKGIIIMDRHVLDFIIGWRLIGISNKFIEWLFLHFPQPNYPIMLIVDPRIAYERKKHEQTNQLNFFIKLHNWTRDLGQKRKYQFFDTGKSLEESKLEIMEFINLK